jgi:short-subunit dehydrogenase
MTYVCQYRSRPWTRQGRCPAIRKRVFSVALISRTQANVGTLAAELAEEGITARGYAADVREPEPLRAALDAAAEELGPIEVLQYSPVPAKEFMKPILDTTVEDLFAPIQQLVYGPISAVQHVLPGLRELGRGTILLINGGSAVKPAGAVAGTSVAFAGESAYGQMLHDALADEGIHVAKLIIPRGIGGGEPDHEPDALAERIWSLHRDRNAFRTVIGE